MTTLECNALLGRGMDLNFFTWLLVTYVSFECTQHQHWFNELAILVMRLHGTLTKYTCLFSTFYISLLVLGGEELPCNLIQVVFYTLGSTSASGETITTFYQSAQLDSGEPNTLGFSNTFSNSIPCVSIYPIVMENQLTRKEKVQVIDLLIKYENVFAFLIKDLGRCKTM